MKLNTILLIVVLVMIPIQICLSDDYQPLTDDEIKAYWNTLTPAERLEEIKKLDLIEHSKPMITGLEFGALIDESGDLIVWPLKPINLKIATLEYEITLPNIYIDNFQEPESKILSYIFIPIACTGIGIVSTSIGGADNLWQYLLSGGIGLVTGIVIDILL